MASSASRSACSADSVWGLAVRGCLGRCRALAVPSLPVPEEDAWMLRLAMCSKPRAWESRPDRYFHQLSTCPLAYDQMWKAMESGRNLEEPRGPSAVGLLFRRVRLLLQVLRPDTGPDQTLLQFTMPLCLWSCTGPRPSGTHLEPACHGLVGGLEAAAACVCNSIVVSKEFIHVQPCCWCSCQFLSDIHQSRRKL